MCVCVCVCGSAVAMCNIAIVILTAVQHAFHYAFAHDYDCICRGRLQRKMGRTMYPRQWNEPLRLLWMDKMQPSLILQHHPLGRRETEREREGER